MKRQIVVDSLKLIDTANKIEAASIDYDRLCDGLYDEIGKMHTSWSGKDNLAYTNQIESYREDLLKIGFMLRQYAGFLKSSASSYEETQDELYSTAMRLKNE